jgi:hypothetical protein
MPAGTHLYDLQLVEYRTMEYAKLHTDGLAYKASKDLDRYKASKDLDRYNSLIASSLDNPQPMSPQSDDA